MTRNGTEALFGMPNTKNETLKIKTKIEFWVKSVPAGKKSVGGVVEGANNDSD